MKRLFLLANVIFLISTNLLFAEVTNPYTVDEITVDKPRILFGDSTEVSGKNGLESYTYNYVNNYLHITFTYTHHRTAFASYPPRLYITSSDPRATSTPTIRDQQVVYQLMAQPVPPGHDTDWYSYDIQFDATGYNVTVLQGGATSTASFHQDISGLATSDWAALANQYPKQDPVNQFSMAFTPLQIYQAPVVSVATTTPVIIVPGIMGSKLEIGGQEKWPNLTEITFSLTDSFLSELNLNSNLESINIVNTPSIVRSLAGQDFFTSLFSQLDTADLEENEDTFEFPYDWRLDIEDTALELKEKIDEIKAQRGVSEVNLVAHSMGGLLVKKYLKDYGGDSVSKFIDIGTPHTGAAKAFKIINYGDNFGFEKVGLNFLNPLRTKEISQNMPAVYELLPSERYFTDYEHYVVDLTDGTSRYNFSQTKDYLKSEGRNSALVDRADEFHDEIDALNPSDYGVETYNIVGCGTPTIGNFYILEDGESPVYNVKMINGDGTVPLKSAEALTASTTYYVRSAQHALMPSTSGVKELVAGLLTSTSTPDISSYSNLSTSSSGCTIPDGKIVSFHSPIELHVYDQSGNHTGPDENGDIENDISGVIYEVIGDNKFAYLPGGTEYTIKGSATGPGSFDVRIQELSGGEVATTTLFDDLPLSAMAQAQFNVGSSTPDRVAVDSDNNGTYEHNFSVSTTTSGILESSDSSEDSNSSPVSPASPSGSTGVSVEKDNLSTTTGMVQGVTIVALPPVPIAKKAYPTPEIQIKESASTSESNSENTAAVYKSFTFKVKNVLMKPWRWIKSRW